MSVGSASRTAARSAKCSTTVLTSWRLRRVVHYAVGVSFQAGGCDAQQGVNVGDEVLVDVVGLVTGRGCRGEVVGPSGQGCQAQGVGRDVAGAGDLDDLPACGACRRWPRAEPCTATMACACWIRRTCWVRGMRSKSAAVNPPALNIPPP